MVRMKQAAYRTDQAGGRVKLMQVQVSDKSHTQQRDEDEDAPECGARVPRPFRQQVEQQEGNRTHKSVLDYP